MLMRRHRRRSLQPTARPARRTGRIVSLGLLALLVIFLCSKVLSYFGVGNTTIQSSSVLTVEDLGIVNVSIDNGPFKRADNGMKIYPGDSVVTTPGNAGSLTFFDGSFGRLDESTQLTVEQSTLGAEQSSLKLNLDEGTMWFTSPKQVSFSGSITRTIATPFLTADIPADTEVLITTRSLVVYSADGPGLSVRVTGYSAPVIVGEGQQFAFPPGSESVPDLYTLRNPINPDLLSPPFIAESRQAFAGAGAQSDAGVSSAPAATGEGTQITVTKPENNITVQGATVEVEGTLTAGVDRVRINGYLATVDRARGTFAQELALPDEDEIRITIEAIDGNGVVVAQNLRTVRRNRTPPEAPAIVSPAATGETYRTGRTQVEITGTAPKDAVAIVVNDYRLQLFSPGDADWSYLADTAFGNFRFGENIFEVSAINQGGYRSDPVRLTVILEEGAEEGTVGSAASEGSVAAPVPGQTAEEAQLPANAPLMPGSVRVTAPREGTEYATMEKEFLIEGVVPAETATVWVNGYRLQLYEAGKTFFNYIASTDLATLRRGRNAYRIVARDKDGNILDEMTYTVQFSPS